MNRTRNLAIWASASLLWACSNSKDDAGALGAEASTCTAPTCSSSDAPGGSGTGNTAGASTGSSTGSGTGTATPTPGTKPSQPGTTTGVPSASEDGPSASVPQGEGGAGAGPSQPSASGSMNAGGEQDMGPPLPSASEGGPEPSASVPTDSPSAGCGETPSGHFQMEDLDRGVVAVRDGNANYVGWRMLGYEYDAEAPSRVTYNLYRDEELVASVTDSTNYLDEGASADAAYSVSVVIDGKECSPSEPVATWAQQYLSIPLTPPPAGTTPDGGSYAYDSGTVQRSSGSVNDGSPGDLDGDGKYEIVVIWEPSNAQDNSKAGYTGPVYVDAYRLDGTRLWRMNLGPNIRAGAHYTQFLVYDLDGDGKAEVALRTAPGSQDASGEYLSKGPAADDDDGEDYRTSDGYVLSGPEYLTVFDGATGLELATANFETARGNVSDWGDDYGNRVDRFLASVGFVSDEGGAGAGSGRPALLMARGYYTRATVNAWTWRDGALTKIWTADSDANGAGALAGQGAHSMTVADVDGDNAQEIVYGAGMIQSDGSFGCATGLNHGDALHAGDFVPSRPGLEVFMPHEDKAKPWWDLRDAKDCTILQQSDSTGQDNGRGVAADVDASNPGAEFWSASDSSLRSAANGAAVGAGKPSPINFAIWWDADDLRELEDGTQISKGDGTRVFSCDQCMSNNYTKATPTLTADLLGDWREEIVWRTPNSSELRVFTTTAVTQRRLYTLMHDPQYRMQVSSEQTAYNQPPNPSFFLGADMPPAPHPNIHIR